jgi:hypothetical protein
VTTTNEYLPPQYIERIWRLAAGVDPVSSLADRAPLAGLELALERVPKPWAVPAGAGGLGNYDVGIGLPTVPVNDSGRFAITYQVSGITSPVAVRLYDTGRRYVPRRFRLPVPTLATVVAEEQAADTSPWPPIPSRAFRPTLYPGAQFGPQAGATTVRGWVVRNDGSPVRWVRVSAIDADHGFAIGWAHGDDRGEFVLVLQTSDAGLFSPASAMVRTTLTISARPTPSTIDSPAQSHADPLWDLEVETLPAPGLPDAVSNGQTPPADYSQSVTSTLTFVKGTSSHTATPFVIP